MGHGDEDRVASHGGLTTPKISSPAPVVTLKWHGDYMDVGIRELKSRLSEFVDRAARGQVIRVTERGRPKAILGPLPGHVDLDRGVQEGWITPGNGEPPAPARRRHGSTETIAQVLAEDRGE